MLITFSGFLPPTINSWLGASKETQIFSNGINFLLQNTQIEGNSVCTITPP